MRNRLRGHLTYANVISTLCLVLIVGGGTAYAVATIGSSDIINDEVYSADVRDDTLARGGLGNVDLKAGSVGSSEVAAESLTSADIADHFLNDDDIAKLALVSFTVSIGSVPAHSCTLRSVSGVNARDDHLILTPDFYNQNYLLVYSASSSSVGSDMVIQACNPTGASINDGNTDFNLLVIDSSD